jgi:hypothetical protein
MFDPAQREGLLRETSSLVRSMPHAEKCKFARECVGSVYDEGAEDFFRLSAGECEPSEVNAFLTRWLAGLQADAATFAGGAKLPGLIMRHPQAANPLAMRMEAWTRQLFSGELEELASDPLFQALSRIHNTHIGRAPYNAEEFEAQLKTAEEHGFSRENLCGGDRLYRQYEDTRRLFGEVDNFILGSRRCEIPQFLRDAVATARADLRSLEKGVVTPSWAAYYEEQFAALEERWRDDERSFL